MIIPIFTIKQNANNLLFKITLPYVKISSVDIYVEGTIFKLFLQPYFLQLKFKNELVYDGVRKAVYDHNTHILDLEVEKKIPGEEFPDLDMISFLIRHAKKDSSLALPKIHLNEEIALIQQELNDL